MQGAPFIGMTTVEPGSTSATMSLSSASLVAVPALAQMIVRVSSIVYFWVHLR
jgi:hypothetical protein